MIVTRHALTSAASQIRETEAALQRIVQELTESEVWFGSDAERFRSDWNELIRARLLRAAGTIEAVSLTTLV